MKDDRGQAFVTPLWYYIAIVGGIMLLVALDLVGAV